MSLIAAVALLIACLGPTGATLALDSDAAGVETVGAAAAEGAVGASDRPSAEPGVSVNADPDDDRPGPGEPENATAAAEAAADAADGTADTDGIDIGGSVDEAEAESEAEGNANFDSDASADADAYGEADADALVAEALDFEFGTLSVTPFVDTLTFDDPDDAAGWTASSVPGYSELSGFSAVFDGATFTRDGLPDGKLKAGAVFPGAGSGWGGIRLQKNDYSLPLNADWNNVTFDVVYENGGNLTMYVELIADDARGDTVIHDGARLTSATNNDPAAGYRRAPVSVFFIPPTGAGETELTSLTIDIYLRESSFANGFFIDNIKFGKGNLPAGNNTLVTNKLTAPTQALVTLPAVAQTVDSRADETTRRLYAYLDAIGKSDYVLFGQQNATFSKSGMNQNNYPGATNNDVKDITGDYPAIFGIDTLSLTGDESGHGGNTADPVRGSADTSIAAARQGMLVTLSAHMSNPGQLKDLYNAGGASRASVFNEATGKWIFRGWGYSNSTQNVGHDPMARILPGGDANDVYRAYLDLIAEYASYLAAEGVPILFRPLHENTGSWFWWGAAFSTPEGFKNVWRYTVEYLRDVKGIHNMLYVYSPGGGFADETIYGKRYPGDEYVDVCAFDQYHNPTTATGWIDTDFRQAIKMVDLFAKRHGKIAAVSETGAGVGSNTVRPTWHYEVLQEVAGKASDADYSGYEGGGVDMAYYMVWYNGSYVPNKPAPTRGQPGVNSFIDFANDPSSVLAGGVKFYEYTEAVAAGPEVRSAYVVSPLSGAFLTDETTVVASL
ncbi:MAG: glycoside hydrolase family 26 protein, partial [Clostridiales bacterium]|nr:glycoside hydrolase family 26 protein [Clostridiales bacterium]